MDPIRLPANGTDCVTLKRKMVAFAELYGREPTVTLEGHFLDRRGDPIFFDRRPGVVLGLGRKYVTVLADGREHLVELPGLARRPHDTITLSLPS